MAPTNIIASQLTFERGPMPHTWVFNYGNYAVGLVERTIVEGKVHWQVEDEPTSLALTREAAVTKFLATNLVAALPC